ncbi:MAG: hypothetical protein WCW67_01885 [Candidatus Margulisiibacteriota bacterium]
MTLQKCFLLLSIILTLVGSYYLVIGNFKSATDIAKESGSYCGGNYALRVSFISARIYSIVGFSLLGFGVALQIISMFVIDRKVNMGVAIGSALIVWGLAILLASLYIHYQRTILIRKTSKIEIMKYEMPKGASVRDRINHSYGGKFIEIGKNFFLLEKNEVESEEDFIERLCLEIGKIKTQ